MTTDEVRSDKLRFPFPVVEGWCDSLHVVVNGELVWLNQKLMDDWRKYQLQTEVDNDIH